MREMAPKTMPGTVLGRTFCEYAVEGEGGRTAVEHARYVSFLGCNVRSGSLGNHEGRV
jgi:hypothetical protein